MHYGVDFDQLCAQLAKMSEEGRFNLSSEESIGVAAPRSGYVPPHLPKRDHDLPSTTRSHTGDVPPHLRNRHGNHSTVTSQTAQPPPYSPKNEVEQTSEITPNDPPTSSSENALLTTSPRSKLNPMAQPFAVSPLLGSNGTSTRARTSNGRGRRFRTLSLERFANDRVNSSNTNAAGVQVDAPQDTFLELTERNSNTTPDHVKIPILEWLHYTRLKKGDDIL